MCQSHRGIINILYTGDNMKIEYINNNKFIVYLNNLYYKFNKDSIEKIILKVLLKLKKIYKIDIYSIFNVECNINKYYGIILVIKKESDSFLLYSKQNKINIRFNNVNVLYEVFDCYPFINKKIYMKDNKYYVKPDIDIINYDYVKNIVFGNKALKIINQ